MVLVAGVDSSTQSCKIEVVDASTGAPVRSGRASHASGTEIDPQLWWDALLTAIADGGGLADVSALSVGAQQHGMVLLDAAGEVIRPALLWNDTRSAAAASALTEEVGAETFARRTGVVPVASFTITKIRWLRGAEPENAARVAAVVLPHDWLTWRLRGYGPARSSPLGPVLEELTTDRSDVSGTGYWSPATGKYDLDLFEKALGRPGREAKPRRAGTGNVPAQAGTGTGTGNVPALVGGGLPGHSGMSFDPGGNTAVVVPRVLDAGATAGLVHSEVVPSVGVAGRVLLGTGAGDNAAAALGLGARPGDVIVSVGTSGTVFAVTDTPISDISGTVAGFADASGLFLPIAVTLNAARVLSSIATVLGVDFDALAELALRAEPGSGGVVLVPYFEGERTPNLPHATASFTGLSIASTTRPNVARAAIEGMLSGLAIGLQALSALGVPANRLMLIGGAVQNPAVQRIAAQVFDLPVLVPTPGEYVARGAAVQAAWALNGSRPQWSVTIGAQPASDFQSLIARQYADSASVEFRRQSAGGKDTA